MPMDQGFHTEEFFVEWETSEEGVCLICGAHSVKTVVPLLCHGATEIELGFRVCRACFELQQLLNTVEMN